jgi:hypothetical protein
MNFIVRLKLVPAALALGAENRIRRVNPSRAHGRAFPRNGSLPKCRDVAARDQRHYGSVIVLADSRPAARNSLLVAPLHFYPLDWLCTQIEGVEALMAPDGRSKIS